MDETLINPKYLDVYYIIREKLILEKSPILIISQSNLELWKLIFNEFSFVSKILIPEYPIYKRSFVELIVKIDQKVHWDYIEKYDYEYYRTVNFFAKNSPFGRNNVIIDLANYNVMLGDYWRNIEPHTIVKLSE